MLSRILRVFRASGETLFFLALLTRVLLSADLPAFPADPDGYVGSRACAFCHPDAARAYSTTAMAHASGPAADLHLPAGVVTAARAQATYSFSSVGPSPTLRYEKAGLGGAGVSGAKTLTYYIGSGAHAQGFLFQESGQPFQAPIAYYGPQRGWDLAPGYQNESSLFLSRKVEPGCLNCHASGVKTSGPVLFQEGAVSCERCHGPGKRHLASVASGNRSAGQMTNSLAIVDPQKLPPEQRDSVCAQCHLTGESRVVKSHRSDLSFRPGDALNTHVVPFIRARPDEAELKVIGHYEGLWQSQCKRQSGDKLWCGTCHDPHRPVAEAEKPAYYREKCLTCHQESSCKLTLQARTSEQDSCIACHMQQRASTDGQHTAFTDHSIRRFGNRTEVTNTSKKTSTELKPFWPTAVTLRDSALAYADQAWLKGDTASLQQALTKLEAARAGAPSDPALLAQLGYLKDLDGKQPEALELYHQALAGDPQNLLASTNLATHLAREGRAEAAAALWRRALIVDPGQLTPGLNLARVEAAQGHYSAALQAIEQVLRLHPDSAPALLLRQQLAKNQKR